MDTPADAQGPGSVWSFCGRNAAWKRWYAKRQINSSKGQEVLHHPWKPQTVSALTFFIFAVLPSKTAFCRGTVTKRLWSPSSTVTDIAVRDTHSLRGHPQASTCAGIVLVTEARSKVVKYSNGFSYWYCWSLLLEELCHREVVRLGNLLIWWPFRRRDAMPKGKGFLSCPPSRGSCEVSCAQFSG